MGQCTRGLLLAEGHPDQADLDRKEAEVFCNAGSLAASHCPTQCPYPRALLAGLDEVSAEPRMLPEFALPWLVLLRVTEATERFGSLCQNVR